MAVIWHSASEKQIRYKTLSYHALTMLFYTGTILRAKYHLKETRWRHEYLVYELNVMVTEVQALLHVHAHVHVCHT